MDLVVVEIQMVDLEDLVVVDMPAVHQVHQDKDFLVIMAVEVLVKVVVRYHLVAKVETDYTQQYLELALPMLEVAVVELVHFHLVE